jgi:hypothetical protein
MKRLPIIFTLIAFSACAYGTIDQSNTASPTLTDRTKILQSFTAGVDDDIIGIWIYMRSRYNGIDDYTVTLYSYADNCINVALTEGTFNESNVPDTAGWFYIEFDAPHLIEAGIQYAFLIDTDGTFGSSGGWIDFGIFSENYDIYDGGEALSYNGTSCSPLNDGKKDFSFQTVVGNNDTGPESTYTPSLLSIAVQNRFNKRITGIPFTANEINSGRSISGNSSDDFVILTASGEYWTAYVKQSDLSEIGYSDVTSFSSLITTSEIRDAIIRISNSNERILTEVTLDTDQYGSRAYLRGAFIHPIQAETKYELLYSRDLQNWYAAETYYASKDRTSTNPQWVGAYEYYTLNNLHDGIYSKVFFMVKASAPE